METWKDIAGYEGLYSVSYLGEIQSHITGKLLKHCNHSCGYKTVCLTKNKTKKTFYVHRIVATAFVKNKDNLQQVNHKDEDKRNNAVSNLEWCTAKYNTNHGTGPRRRVVNTDYKAMGNKLSKILSSGRVKQFSLDGKFLNEYESASRASIAVSGKRNYNIYRCLRGEANTAYGYLWKYASGER